MIISVNEKYQTQLECLEKENFFNKFDLKVLEDLTNLILPYEFKINKMEQMHSVKLKKISNNGQQFSLYLGFPVATKKCAIAKICNGINGLSEKVYNDFFYDIECIFQLNKELHESLFFVITLYNNCMENYFRVGKERTVDGKFKDEGIITEYTFQVLDGKPENTITLFNLNY